LIAGGRLQTTREFENEALSSQIPPGAPINPMSSREGSALAVSRFNKDEVGPYLTRKYKKGLLLAQMVRFRL